jgi:hypothetical protein
MLSRDRRSGRSLNDLPLKWKMDRLVTTLREQQAEGQRLDAAIGDALRSLGWEL